MNIYEKLLNISNEIGSVNKNLEVGFGQAKYKAVGEADVLKAVKELEKKYGIYSYPCKRTIIDSSVIETINSKGEPKKNLYERIETIYRFVNVEKPDEYIEITTYGDGIDPSDKSVGKAMTYADKYALLKAYKIVTGDDPDQHASEELKSKTPSKAEEPKTQGTDYKAIYSAKLNEWWQKGETFQAFITSELNSIGKKAKECDANELRNILKKLNNMED